MTKTCKVACCRKKEKNEGDLIILSFIKKKFKTKETKYGLLRLEFASRLT